MGRGRVEVISEPSANETLTAHSAQADGSLVFDLATKAAVKSSKTMPCLALLPLLADKLSTHVK